MLASDDQPDCRTVQSWMGLHLDAHLAPEDRSAFQAHLAACPACDTEMALLKRTKTRLLESESEVVLPPTLLAAVAQELDAVDAQTQRRGRRRLAALALSGLLVSGGAVALWAAPTPVPSVPTAVAESVARHQQNLPVDVASPNPEQVELYLARNLNHRVRVPRLQRVGFALRGARVVRMQNRLAAQLLYRGALGDRLSVLAIPDPSGTLRQAFAPGGSRPEQGANGDVTPLFEAQKGAYHVQVHDLDHTLYTVVSETGPVTLSGFSAPESAPESPVAP